MEMAPFICFQTIPSTIMYVGKRIDEVGCSTKPNITCTTTQVLTSVERATSGAGSQLLSKCLNNGAAADEGRHPPFFLPMFCM